jgi:hypothetical protein
VARARPPAAQPSDATSTPLHGALWENAVQLTAGHAAHLASLADEGNRVAASLRTAGHVAMAALVDNAVAGLRTSAHAARTAATTLEAVVDPTELRA